jgi:hypothetical protein
MNHIISKVEELKQIGIQFDENNVKSCLNRYKLRCQIREVLSLAKELGLDITKDKTKSSVSVVVSNFSDINGCRKQALNQVYQEQTPLIIETLKTTNIFKEILFILGEAVVRSRFHR